MQQNTLLIACALKQECSRLRRSLSGEAGGGVRFRHTGMGPVKAADRLDAILQEEHPRLLIFTGTAGGLDPALEMGQIVLPRAWSLQDGPRFDNDAALLSIIGRSAPEPDSKAGGPGSSAGSADRRSALPRRESAAQPPTVESRETPARLSPDHLSSLLTPVELGLTVSRPILRPSTRRRLHRQTGASVCDMESAAVLQSAASLGIPAVALKVVSDTGSSGLTDFWKHFEANLDRLAQALQVLLSRRP